MIFRFFCSSGIRMNCDRFLPVHGAPSVKPHCVNCSVEFRVPSIFLFQVLKRARKCGMININISHLEG